MKSYIYRRKMCTPETTKLRPCKEERNKILRKGFRSICKRLAIDVVGEKQGSMLMDLSMASGWTEWPSWEIALNPDREKKE
jgi:hypothetical protein